MSQGHLVRQSLRILPKLRIDPFTRSIRIIGFVSLGALRETMIDLATTSLDYSPWEGLSHQEKSLDKAPTKRKSIRNARLERR
jgi:hypothetical protein